MAWMENMGEIFHDPLLYGKFHWTVPNVFLDSKAVSVASSWFPFENNEWRLVLLHNNATVHAKNYSMENGCVGFFIKRKYMNCSDYEFDVKLNLEMTGYRVIYYSYSLDRTWTLPPDEDTGDWCFLPLSAFSEYKELLSPQGYMKFSCTLIKKMPFRDITIDDAESLDEVCVEDIKKKNATRAKGLDRLVQNLKSMLLEGQNSDTILKVENREFPVHRAVLCARSPVFATMFEHGMAESISGVVDIPDSSEKAFEIFLLYLYTGNSDTISADIVFNLYYIADKYRVDDLKEECTELMKNSLSIDTFCDVLSLSLTYNESELEREATRFFCDNVRRIIKTVQWQKYIQENPLQANNLHIKSLNA